MQRYLLFFSYIGTRLRGIQKQNNIVYNPGIPFRDSVQGLLESGLKRLEPANEPIIIPSSRTDVGVHSFCNTAHVDLQHPTPGALFSPSAITTSLNRHFETIDTSIIVQKTFAVSQDFHARYNALGRTYLYRLAVYNPPRESENEPELTARRLFEKLPVTEWKRSYIISGPFDLLQAQKACQLIQGPHDFASFVGKIDQNRRNGGKEITTERTLVELCINPSVHPIHPVAPWDPSYQHLQFYDVTVHARAFLYRQVRRIVGVLIAVAQGKLSLNDVQYLLDNPGSSSWNPRASVVPPHGLYLVRVHYDPVHFQHEFLPRPASEEAAVPESSANESVPL